MHMYFREMTDTHVNLAYIEISFKNKLSSKSDFKYSSKILIILKTFFHICFIFAF